MMPQMLANTVMLTRAPATAAPLRNQRVQSVRPAAQSARTVFAAASGPETPVSTTTSVTPVEASAGVVEPVAAMASASAPMASAATVASMDSGFLGATQELMNGCVSTENVHIPLGCAARRFSGAWAQSAARCRKSVSLPRGGHKQPRASLPAQAVPFAAV